MMPALLETFTPPALGSKSDRVICICGGFGFPFGQGSTARITMIGKALQAAGIGFHVFHCGPSPVAENDRRRGTHEGISFEYTACLTRPKNRLARSFVYLWAVAGLTARLLRLWPARRRTAVYLYVMGGLLNFYTARLCWLLGIPVVQELCEWWPGEPECTRFTNWLFKGPLFTAATGILAISRAIERKSLAHAATDRPGLLVYRLPSVVDSEQFAARRTSQVRTAVPNFVWCGAADGWLRDVLFLVRALARVKRRGITCQLTVIGSYSDATGSAITAHAVEHGVSISSARTTPMDGVASGGADVVLRGWVAPRTLRDYYHSAAALLLPLWRDNRSVTRMPNKLPEYLASGTPVITSGVGDLTEFLVDGVNACVGEPGDEESFASAMIAAAGNGRWAARIGAAGRATCFELLDYRAHIDGLSTFFRSCIHRNAAL